MILDLQSHHSKRGSSFQPALLRAERTRVAEMKAAPRASQVLGCSGQTSAFHCGGVGGFARQVTRSG